MTLLLFYALIMNTISLQVKHFALNITFKPISVRKFIEFVLFGDTICDLPET